MNVSLSSDDLARGKRLSALLRSRADSTACKVSCGPTAYAILEEIADRYGLSPAEIIGKEVVRRVAWPRQEVMWTLYQTGRYSLPEIGRFLGGRDHTTILFGVRKHAKRMAAASEMQEAA